MAKKTRKQKQRAAARRGVAARPSLPPAGLPERVDEAAVAYDIPGDPEPDADSGAGVTAAATAGAATAGAATAAAEPRRRIERLSQAAVPAARAVRPGRGPANAAAMFQPLDSEDAAIPFDRVPYVPADLKRVAITAALMVVLILVAAIVVTHVVQ